MPSPAPQQEAVEVFNQLAHAEADDQARASHALARALVLMKVMPGNFLLRTTLAGAYLLLGNREKAEHSIDGAFNTRTSDHPGTMCLLARVCLALGHAKYARTIFDELIESESYCLTSLTIGNASRFAVCVGDWDFLQYLNTLDIRTGADAHYAREALARLKRDDFFQHLAIHQKIIIDIVGDFQMWIGSDFHPEQDLPGVSVQRYLSPEVNRHKIQRKVSDALFAYYENKGLAPGYYRLFLTTQFLTMPGESGEIEAA